MTNSKCASEVVFHPKRYCQDTLSRSIIVDACTNTGYDDIGNLYIYINVNIDPGTCHSRL